MNAIVKINHLFLSPPINNMTNVIIIYIITAPVSGSINVNIDGISTINTSCSINNQNQPRLYMAKNMIADIYNSSGKKFEYLEGDYLTKFNKAVELVKAILS